MKREGRPIVFVGRRRFACGEAGLPLHFGTEFLFLLVSEEPLKARLFVRLGNELFERMSLPFGFSLLCFDFLKFSEEAVDPTGLFFQFAISLGKKSINDFLPSLQNGLFG